MNTEIMDQMTCLARDLIRNRDDWYNASEGAREFLDIEAEKIAGQMREALAPDYAETVAACKNLVKSVEDWNADVQKIIGRVPQTGMGGPIDEARRAITKAEGRAE